MIKVNTQIKLRNDFSQYSRLSKLTLLVTEVHPKHCTLSIRPCINNPFTFKLSHENILQHFKIVGYPPKPISPKPYEMQD